MVIMCHCIISAPSTNACIMECTNILKPKRQGPNFFSFAIHTLLLPLTKTVFRRVTTGVKRKTTVASLWRRSMVVTVLDANALSITSRATTNWQNTSVRAKLATNGSWSK